MKFNKCVWSKVVVTERTPRRVAAAKRAVQRQKDKYALFPELVEHNSEQERMDAMDVDRNTMSNRMRAFAAEKWRQARRELNTSAIVAAGIKLVAIRATLFICCQPFATPEKATPTGGGFASPNNTK